MSLVWSWALPATEKLVALKLADCADDSGRNAYPAVDTIAAECGLSPRGTQKVLKRLVEKGCIEVQSGWTNRKSTTYRVRLDAQLGGEHDSPQSAARGERGSPLGVNVVPAEVNVVHPGGERGSPLEVNVVHPIHPGSVLEPSQTPRVRDGRRPHPLDEPIVLAPQSLVLFDELWAIYPCKDRKQAALDAWRLLDPSLDVAGLIVAHVRIRLKTGWRNTAPRYVPQLARFLEERRWQERDAAVQTSAPGGLATEGIFALALCPACGGEQEGRVVNGRPVYPPCPRCARAGDEGLSERGRLVS